MEEVSSTPKLVDAASVDTNSALRATLPRFEIESALNDNAAADLFLEIARIQNGERDDRTVKIAWERSDLEELLQRAPGDAITLTFDETELQHALDGPDVEAQGLREKALVLTVAVATAAGIAGSATAQVMSEGSTTGTPPAVSGLVTDNSPLAAPDAASSVPADGWMSGVESPPAATGAPADGWMSGVESPVATTGAPADGWMSGVESPVTADPTGIGQPSGGGSGFTVPDSAIEAALAGGLALLITGAALVTRTQRRRELPT